MKVKLVSSIAWNGEHQEAGPLASDAKVAVIGHNRRGQLQHRVQIGGTSLTYKGTNEAPKARRHDATPLVQPKDLQ